MTSLQSRFVLALLAAATCVWAVGLSACGKPDDPQAVPQVVAKVGSEEISMRQVNQVLSRANAAGVTPEIAQAMRREVLEKLIDQQVAVNQATQAQLQRSPDVLSQIESASREILARAYLQQLASAVPKPSAEDVKKYYTEHPQLFSERRVFNVQEIVVPVNAGVTEALRGFAAAGKPIEDVAALLKARDIKFGGGSAQRAAEQIPLALLTKIHSLQDGQSTLIETLQTVTLLRIASSQKAPLSEAAALPRIEQFLSNQRAGVAVAAKIKELRAATPVTYMGEFSQAGALPPAAAAASLSSPAQR